MTLVDAPRLGWPHRGKIIFGIEVRITKNEIRFTVEVRRAGFRRDLDAPASRTGELGGVRIVVSSDFLNGRGRYAHTFHLDPINDQSNPAGRTGRGVKK